MTTFGEIVEPTTRTAWEDWDDTVPSASQQLKWKIPLDTQRIINTFLLCEGKYLSDCIKNQSGSKLRIVNAIPEVGLELYRHENLDKYVCVVKDYDIVVSGEVVCLLQPLLECSHNVIAMQMKPIVEYQSSEVSIHNCVMRTVVTSETPALSFGYPKLEQPNIISGVAAGVICLREHLRKSGIGIVCYVEHPEEFHVQEIQKLLSSLDVVNDIKTQSTNNNILFTNLYI